MRLSPSGLRLRSALLIALAFAAASPARAQVAARPPADTVSVRTITLDEAVRLALSQNVSLRRAATAQRQASFAVDAARIERRPSLSLQSNAGQSYGRTLEENRIVDQSIESASAGLNAGVTLFDGGSVAARVRAARADLEASGWQRDRASQTVVFNVATGYLTVLARRSNSVLLQQTLDDARALLARIDALIEGGARPRSDRYAQEAEVAQAEYNVASAERDAAVADLQLVQLLGLDPAGTYRFASPDVPDIGGRSFAAGALDADALLANAYDARADLRAQTAEIRAGQANVRLAQAAARPRVSASVGYSSSVSTGYGRFEQDPVTGEFTSRPVNVFDQLNERRGGNFGLNVSYPIYDRGASRNSTQRARAALDDARLALEAQRQAVATEVEQAVLDLRAAERQVASSVVQVDAARRALQAAEDRYALGAGTVYDVTQARTALLRAESALLNARFTFLLQKKVIDYYAGTLDPANVSLD